MTYKLAAGMVCIRKITFWAMMPLIVVLPGQAYAQTHDVPVVSWGKSGITFEQYRADALDCGKNGLASDIDNSDPVNTLRRAETQLEAIDTQPWAMTTVTNNKAPNGGVDVDTTQAVSRAHDEQAIMEGTRPKEQYARIKQLMFVAVRKCMIDHGYARFALTEAQRAEMRRIKDPVPRRAYLFGLASDANVLDKQKIHTATQ